MMLMVLCSFFCFAAVAQDSNSNYANGDSLANGKMKNYITMTGGKIMVMKEGMSKQLTKDKTLDDGTVVRTDGTIILRNGQIKTLTEGQKFYFMEKKRMNGGSDPQNKKDSTQ